MRGQRGQRGVQGRPGARGPRGPPGKQSVNSSSEGSLNREVQESVPVSEEQSNLGQGKIQ